MLIPWSNNLGAICGAIAGAVMSGWISFGTQAAIASGATLSHPLNISVDGCEKMYGNFSVNNLHYEHDESEVFPLYRLSFHWINPFGILSVLIVGTIGNNMKFGFFDLLSLTFRFCFAVSFLSGPRDLRKIDPELISPVIHRFLPDECFIEKRSASTEPTTESFTLKLGQSNHNDDFHPTSNSLNCQTHQWSS